MSYFYMIISCMLFSIMIFCVKFLSTSISIGNIVFYRFLLIFVIISSVMIFKKISVKTSNLTQHFKISVFGFLGILFGFYALSNLPIATATILTYTNPIFQAIISFVLLKKRISFILWVSIFLGFSGVILTLNLNIIMFNIAAFSGLLSGFFTAYTYYNISMILKKNEPEIRVVFYFSLIGMVFSMLLFIDKIDYNFNKKSVIYIVIMGFSGFLGQFYLTKSYGYGNIVNVSILSYLTIIFSIVIGIVFLDEKISPLALVGIMLIILAGILSTINKNKTIE